MIELLKLLYSLFDNYFFYSFAVGAGIIGILLFNKLEYPTKQLYYFTIFQAYTVVWGISHIIRLLILEK